MTKLIAKDISVIVGEAALVTNASLSLSTGELVAILGANGAGKTTLLRAVMGLGDKSGGSSSLDESDCAHLSAIERARLISYLPQRRPLAWPNLVRDIVALGRFAHGATLGKLGNVDQVAVNRALVACDLLALADRNADTLSGGEIARVHFARAIAAQAPLLVTDEPTAALDPLHQLKIAQLTRDFVENGGGALVVLHDVALAARFADKLIWMREGRIISSGTPEETLNAKTMADVYGVKAHVSRDEHGFDVRIEASM